jgi:hypothetical protein
MDFCEPLFHVLTFPDFIPVREHLAVNAERNTSVTSAAFLCALGG